MHNINKNVQSQQHITRLEIHKITSCSSGSTHKVPLA